MSSSDAISQFPILLYRDLETLMEDEKIDKGSKVVSSPRSSWERDAEMVRMSTYLDRQII